MLSDFRARQRDYLLEISRALNQELDLDTLLGRILIISIEMLAGHAGLIALRSQAGEWRVSVSHSLPAAFLKYLEPYLAEIPPNPHDPESTELPEINRVLQQLTFAASMGLVSSVGLPLIARQTVVGAIFIFRGYAGLFSANDRALLRAFADQAAIAVQNAQLYTQISQEKDRLDALLDSTADGMLILDSAHKVERGNPAMARLLGITPQEMTGKQHNEVIQWANPPQGLTLEAAEAGGWPLTPHAQLYVEGDLKRSDPNPPTPVGITYAPLVTQEGKLLNVIATVRDITRFRQAEELKTTFVSIISHELKTPVALIKGYVSTLRREDARWDRRVVNDSLQVIEEEADRLTLMIENLLDASRLAAGGMAIKRSDVLLSDLARRLSARFQIQTTQHTLKTDFPPDFPVILADETRLEQVISNLILNSIKYAPGGEIVVSGQVRPEQVIVCVSDQGPGIAPQDIPHIFDRFYRAPDMARLTKGAGLGLFLAKSIVEAHGGRIWVDPESGQGARICFSLPRNLDLEN
jgi:signal transduction histidine kinase